MYESVGSMYNFHEPSSHKQTNYTNHKKQTSHNMIDMQLDEYTFDTPAKKVRKSTAKKHLTSFSGVSYTELFSSWRKSLIEGDYETCCHWSIEIALSGWVLPLWETIHSICAKYIHIQNPKIILFLQKMSQDYPYFTTESENSPATFRKTPPIREALACIIGVICYSPKGVVYPIPSLKLSDSEIETALYKLRNGSICPEIQPICQECDSHIVCTLLSACFTHMRNTDLNNVLRTFGWLLTLEKSKKIQNELETTHYSFRKFWKNWNDKNIEIPENCSKDWVFLFWDGCFEIMHHLPCIKTPEQKKMCSRILNAWKEFYFSRFSKQNKKSRVCILIQICIFFSQKKIPDISCIHNEKVIQKACSNVDVMYNEIMSNQYRVI